MGGDGLGEPGKRRLATHRSHQAIHVVGRETVIVRLEVGRHRDRLPDALGPLVAAPRRTRASVRSESSSTASAASSPYSDQRRPLFQPSERRLNAAETIAPVLMRSVNPQP